MHSNTQIHLLATILLLAGPAVAAAAAVEKTSLSPPVLLPNGEEFKTWQAAPLPFTRTYYVAQVHPKASDDNPGTEELPLKTIDRAAQLLQPGERVVVGAGVYRERVRPARGGTGPERMIGYQAAAGATVVLSGSEVLKTAWTPSRHEGSPGGAKLWMTQMPKDLFPHENPFAQVNLTDEQIDRCMPWALNTRRKVPNTLRRGLVFQNGERLRQVAAYDDLAAAGTYWVEQDGLTVHVHPLADADPNQAKIEVTTRGMIFAPAEFGLGYICVKGFTIEHAGNCFPRPQQGALSTMRGHHWIIEQNTVRQCNAIGIDIGDQFDIAGPRLAEGGQHIVRRNTVSDCGIGGIEGHGIQHTLIEENHIFACGWQKAEHIWETAGIKVHGARGSLLRKNVIHDTINAPGIWMDYDNRNSRCTQNLLYGTRSTNGSIFMEASQTPNLVDRNIVWGATGAGIYQHDCDGLLILHNLVGQSTDAGIRMQVTKGRIVGGRLATARRNKIEGNILLDTRDPMAITDRENTVDWNLFGASRRPFDLAAWRAKYGWDEHSAVARIEAAFDPKTRQLTWSVKGDVPQCPRQPALTADFFGRAYSGSSLPPGPFAVLPSTGSILLGGGDQELHGQRASENKAGAPPPQKPHVAVTISKETTYITGPLRKDGYVDYVAALNERSSKGVTPENNAAVPFLKAMWPGVMDASFDKMDAKYRDEYCRMLGIQRLPEKGDYYVALDAYVKGLQDAEQPGVVAGEEWREVSSKQLPQAMKRPWSKQEFPILAGWLAANERPLALLVAASQRPRRYDPLISKDGSVIGGYFPTAAEQYRGAARALTARAMLRVDEGHVDEAWEDLLACHRLARLAGQGPMLVEELIAVTADAMACAGDQALLQHARLAPARIARMRADLDKLPSMPKMVDKIDVGERFMFLDCARMGARQGLDESTSLSDPGSTLKSLIASTTAAAVDWDRVLRMGNSWYDRMADACRKPTRAERLAALRKIDDEVRKLGKKIQDLKSPALLMLGGRPDAVTEWFGEALVSLLLPALSSTATPEDRAAMQFNLIRLAFALAAYHADQDVYPPRLADLVPKYLAEVPNDIFSRDADLHYAREGKGYLLYSVGPNGKDDGGKSYDDRKYGDDWDDIVVRVPAAVAQKQ